MAGVMRKLASFGDPTLGIWTLVGDGMRALVLKHAKREKAPGEPPKVDVAIKEVPEWPADDKYPKTPWR